MDDSEMDVVEHLKRQQMPMRVKPTGEMLTCRRSDSMPDQRDEYDFSYPRRGMAIIINNETFHPSTGQINRTGTNLDAVNVEETFKDLQFDVCRYDNLSAKQIIQKCQTMSGKDHSDADCFVCVILTHGEEDFSQVSGRYDVMERNDVIFGVDTTIYTKDILACFTDNKCPSLAGKPKLFFIQACRGQLLDSGVTVLDTRDDVVDASVERETVQVVPIYEDFLLMYATPPGYYAFRRQSTGSWFIQALCKVLQSHKNGNLMQALTRVNRLVARDYESSSPYFSKKKQMPCIYSKLTRDVIFTPKQFYI